MPRISRTDDMEENLPSHLEDDVSQVPALQLLINMGWEYLSPEEALAERGGKRSKVILENILKEKLKSFNTILFKGQKYPFSESNIENAIRVLRDQHFQGLIKTNEEVYDLLTLGKSMEQTIDSITRSFQLNYIDWEVLTNNSFHVTEEFSVERTGSKETRRPDIVLFVNGIPLVVIECKRSGLKKDPINEAITQQLRNQQVDEIPQLFYYSQLLLALCYNDGSYGTTATEKKYWAKWQSEVEEETLNKLINKPLSKEKKSRLFNHKYRPKAKGKQEYFDAKEAEGPRLIYEQDRVIFGLLEKEKLLTYIFSRIVYDTGVKKVARYNQDRLVTKTLERVHQFEDGKRKGGVIWHTQGSGKSISMVLIAKALALDPRIPDARIVLVTDRTDLDEQLGDNFKNCGLEVEQAKTGSHLFKLIQSDKHRIVLTIINKFKAALKNRNLVNESPDVFALIDESHRTQHGTFHTSMRKVFPNACYLGFTGTPLIKKDKNDLDLFGGFIDTYTIDDALRDKVVCPLIYEGRYVEQEVDKKAIDSWFERVTERLTDEQKADLKKKFSTADKISQTDQRIMMVAYDINDHFTRRENLTFKGQIVTRSKAAALKYKRYLDQIGDVTSEVIISPPDATEGDEDVGQDKKMVDDFWKSMMERYGTEKSYNKLLINSYKKGDKPEILIVVDKLITGFDAPRNTYLYLDRKFGEPHTLLQAIARVNRLFPGKEQGFIIDYAGVLGQIDSAKKLYAEILDSYDEEDVRNTFRDIRDELNKLPQRHSDLRDVFKSVESNEQEAYERFLEDEEIRSRFYEKLRRFSRIYRIAITSVHFELETDDKTLERYRKDFKFFTELRRSVQRRYGETIDLRDYDPQIKKLLDQHVAATSVEQIVAPTSIYDIKYEEEKETFENTRAKADYIASVTERTINERMEDDPVFYKQLSEMLRDVIDKARQGRISDAEKLQLVLKIEEQVKHRSGDSLPSRLEERDPVAKAYYGFAYQHLKNFEKDTFNSKEVSADVAVKIDDIVLEHRIRDWIDNQDVKNKMLNEIEDHLFDLKARYGLNLSLDAIDEIMAECMKVAERRRAI